ncbi:GGDEF domain-containing protein [Rhodanobacter glycinis]|uniref:GGDEF domain-containing protein n=1 Tax=Rhodanobacter glycinis TaxID=582702 RepID=UPI001F4FBFED|nr:GGDEF domain-containing protein [Rhodanobacter glycinis]
MVKSEITQRDCPTPLHTEPGAPVAGAVPVLRVPPSTSAAGMLAHSRLLDSVAAFTHHRDIDALDHSLVLSLAELALARSVSLAKRAAGGCGELESVVHCTPDAQGHYQLQVIEPDQADPALASMRQCIERPEVLAEIIGPGMHRLVAPILCEGRAIGALQLDSEVPPSASRSLVEGFARIYANYTALLNESERDKLTGLYNRRTFERHLQRLLSRHDSPARADELAVDRRGAAAPVQVWLAILDIDHFKRINDSYGHIYGDEVILLLAQQMRASFRQGDVLFRFGGEEFVVLLSASDESTVHAALERFRRRVAAQVFPQVEHVTVSIGYARIGDSDYPATVLDRADKALYFAKKNGRDRTHGYESLAAQGLLAQAMAPGSIDLF